MKIVALVEHFAPLEGMDAWKSVDPGWRDLALKATTEGEGARRLLDLGAERLDAMNEAGIDVAVISLTTPAALQGTGLGLTSMRGRVRLANGTISIDSKPMGGTTIHVRVPLESKHAAKREAI
jgi:Histidine kinase-, DNA gyrase B-, and HSP90-like ATPase